MEAFHCARLGIFNKAGEWIIENEGVSPTSKVEMTPKAVIEGKTSAGKSGGGDHERIAENATSEMEKPAEDRKLEKGNGENPAFQIPVSLPRKILPLEARTALRWVQLAAWGMPNKPATCLLLLNVPNFLKCQDCTTSSIVTS